MIITMKKDTPEQEIKNLMESIEAKGVKVTMIQGTNYNVFGLVGDTTVIDDRMITANPYVDNVKRIAAPYKKANRLFHPLDSVIDVDGIKVGGKEKIVVIGGPCSVEGEESIMLHCKRSKRGRRLYAARWCVQTKNFSVFFPRYGFRRFKMYV